MTLFILVTSIYRGALHISPMRVFEADAHGTAAAKLYFAALPGYQRRAYLVSSDPGLSPVNVTRNWDKELKASAAATNSN